MGIVVTGQYIYIYTQPKQRPPQRHSLVKLLLLVFFFFANPPLSNPTAHLQNYIPFFFTFLIHLQIILSLLGDQVSVTLLSSPPSFLRRWRRHSVSPPLLLLLHHQILTSVHWLCLVLNCKPSTNP